MGIHESEGIPALSNILFPQSSWYRVLYILLTKLHVKLGKDILDFLKLIHLVFTSLLLLVCLYSCFSHISYQRYQKHDTYTATPLSVPLTIMINQSWPLSPIPCRFGCSFKILFFVVGKVACGILVPQPGIKPAVSTMEVQNLNHWTTREVPRILLHTVQLLTVINYVKGKLFANLFVSFFNQMWF